MVISSKITCQKTPTLMKMKTEVTVGPKIAKEITWSYYTSQEAPVKWRVAKGHPPSRE